MLLGLWGKDALDHIVALMGALASAPLALVCHFCLLLILLSNDRVVSRMCTICELSTLSSSYESSKYQI